MGEVQRERYKNKLREALKSLQISASAYDMGAHSEAIRLATTLRVLFHKGIKGGCIPLLEHLGMMEGEMLSTCEGDIDPLGFVNLQINLRSPTPIVATPRLGNQFGKMSISHWWGRQVVLKSQEQTYFRRNLIRTATDQDGGAHVDVRVVKFYEDLEAGIQLPNLIVSDLKYPNNQAPYDQTKHQYCRNAHLAMLRQFAHEALKSAEYFTWIRG